MKRLQEIIAKLKNIQSESLKIAEQVVRDNEAIVLDMNIQDQLFERGINRLGVDISSYAPYTALTVYIKKAKGQPTNRVTLKDEGDFYHSFRIEFQTDGFKIIATDRKTEDLVIKYGDEILGLTDANFQEIIDSYVRPEIIKLIKTL